MRILIMGLSGSGKTTLAKKLVGKLKLPYVNADVVRKHNDDWDFSEKGRLRQADRMKKLLGFGVSGMADFICPTKETRDAFDPDFIIWMNTIVKSQYDDTDELFEMPEEHDIEIIDWDYDVDDICAIIDKRKKELECQQTNSKSSES